MGPEGPGHRHRRSRQDHQRRTPRARGHFAWWQLFLAVATAGLTGGLVLGMHPW